MSKKALLQSDDVSTFFYWIVYNDGIPLKVTYAIKFYPTKTESQKLKLLFSIFIKDATVLLR